MEKKETHGILEEIIKLIHNFIFNPEATDRSIDAVYIFGSVLNQSQFKKNSDIDIAFLIDKLLYKQDALKASVDAYIIATKIGLTLDRSTDVIIMNSASIETAFQIMTTGIPVYEHHPDKRIEYEIAVKGMYYDFKPFLDDLRSKAVLELNQHQEKL